MITTLDNKVVKKGGRVWEIGVLPDGYYKPSACIVHGGSYHPTNPDKTWSTYDLCLEECKKLDNKTP